MSGRDPLNQLRERLRAFTRERGWDRYHTAKNLTTALAGEAGELAAVLQWATPEEPIDPYRAELEEEIGDVLIYPVRVCDVIDIDPVAAANAKVERNTERFPARELGPRGQPHGP
jgi:NTP pyrophosphatase (non-canonical NTP hydrolase)